VKRRLAAGSAAIVGTALLLAGCGGSGGGGRLSKSQYEQKLRTEGKTLQGAFTGISANPSSLKDLATSVGQAQRAADKAANDLNGLKPPQDAAADNQKLVAALHVIADEMGKLKSAADKGDQAAAAKVSQDLNGSAALKDAQAATNDLKKKGYQIGVLGQ